MKEAVSIAILRLATGALRATDLPLQLIFDPWRCSLCPLAAVFHHRYRPALTKAAGEAVFCFVIQAEADQASCCACSSSLQKA